MKKIFIIIPVYNRKETTLKCLRRLKATGSFEWAHVVVVDDASPDGTGKAIEAEFSSEHVTVLYGDGNLWWAGGICKGMEHAYEQGADFFVWLNDDCRPKVEGALKVLVDYSMKHQCISVGKIICVSGCEISGARKGFWHKIPVICAPEEVQPCDTFGGNAVCFPRYVIDRIGYPDAEHFPMMADTDYGLRATKNSIPACIVGECIFENDDNLSIEQQSFLLSDTSTTQLIKARFFSVKSFCYLPSYYRMRIRHFGLIRGHVIVACMLLKYAIYTGLRMCMPRKLLIRLFGRHLRAWKIQSYHN